MRGKQQKYYRGFRYYLLRLYRFLRLDMWQVTREETPSVLRPLVDVIKVVYQTTRAGIEDNLMGRAASLTYSTVLSIVPMLAVIVGIAKGFGLQNVVRNTLIDSLPAQREQLEQAFVYVENYLEQVQGGLFIGLGLGILLYTVIILIATIEDSFNEIWQAPHARPWTRRILDYLGWFILLPFVLTISSLFSIVSSAIKNTVLVEIDLFNTLINYSLAGVPLLISIVVFASMYFLLPNVKVKLLPALIAGVVAGLGYHILQSLYIDGVIWISRYNAIYGSFAAFPLLLLFIQASWTITLFGAQLSYTIQNINSFTFEHLVYKTTRRYRDFVALLILQRMLQRFRQEGQQPYTLEELSRECKIPLRLTASTLAFLEETQLITEVLWCKNSDNRFYQPAVNPELMTISYVVERLDRHGSEDFRIDRYGKYLSVWQATLVSRGLEHKDLKPSTLIQDL